MSKKVDFPELRAQLEALNNKELHHKCVEHGMNVPVADSTRDVIIRKLIKTITGGATVVSPKANKKQTSTPNDRRKTVNVTVHVSSDEEEAGRQKQPPATKNRTRTQSPKGHNVTFDTTVDNHRHTFAAPAPAPKQQKSPAVDVNTNVGVGLGSKARIVPIEVDLFNTTDHDDYNIEVSRPSLNRAPNNDINFNKGRNFTEGYNTTHPNQNYDSGYKGSSPNLSYSQPRTLNSTYQQDLREPLISNYNFASPNLGFSQTRTLNTTFQQDANSSSRQGFIASPQGHENTGSLGFYTAGSPSNSFNIENMASHSSTLGGTSPSAKEPLFKRPTALSKTNVTSSSYNQADAQRLYPRLPTDLVTPPTYTSSPPSTPDSQQSTRSGREPSLTKSGVMTTSYYQEIAPVKEVKHFEVESGDEPADVGARDYSRSNTAASPNYNRSSYLAGIQRGTEAHMPFESNLQSTLRDSIYTTPRYASSPITKETYIPSTASPKAPLSPTLNRYSTTTRANTSYTRSIDEPDSGSEGEQLSGDEIYVQDSDDEEEYLADTKKIYSSYGSNKIQERVPYRRSNTARLNASPTALYNQSVAGRSSFNPDDDDDDINASLKNFLTTLDRKYHIKQMMYMFAIFAAAVFIYVVFFEKTPIDDDDVVQATKMRA
ncbi:uncharacterized protein LOC118738989 [Rhagoletis pomonella]|uniref:uncharacterized protein LOC118738989 n=1 Tax=Rhagoletis pomonella TaxID=28610 RepID=UPI00178454C8|nr:uncharacterized protein LOC118738989 [Rhagoletis pomonella]